MPSFDERKEAAWSTVAKGASRKPPAARPSLRLGGQEVNPFVPTTVEKLLPKITLLMVLFS